MSTKRKAVLVLVLGTLVVGLVSLPFVFQSFQKTLVSTSTATPSAPFFYTVVEGDTLSSISEKFHLGEDGVQFLITLNPPLMDSDGNVTGDATLVFPGQQLLIPGAGMKLPPSATN